MAYDINVTRKIPIAVDIDRLIKHYLAPLGESPYELYAVQEEEAFQWLVQATETYDIHIISYRSKTWTGRREMRAWLKNAMRESLGTSWYETYRSLKWPKGLPQVDLIITDRHVVHVDHLPSMLEIKKLVGKA